jgi:hypothetical protein
MYLCMKVSFGGITCAASVYHHCIPEAFPLRLSCPFVYLLAPLEDVVLCVRLVPLRRRKQCIPMGMVELHIGQSQHVL